MTSVSPPKFYILWHAAGPTSQVLATQGHHATSLTRRVQMSVGVDDDKDRFTRCRDLVRDSDHRASSLTRGVQMSVDVGVLEGVWE